MLKNIKNITAMLTFAALLGSAGIGTAVAQSKTSRARDNGSAPKGDRNRAGGDEPGKVDRDAERGGAGKKTEDRNDRAPSKNKQRR